MSDEVPRVTEQAGIGGAELPQMGALARYTQDAIGQEGTVVAAVLGVAATGKITVSNNGDLDETDTITIGDGTFTLGEDLIKSSAEETRDALLDALEEIATAAGVELEADSTDAIKLTAFDEGTNGNDIATAVTGTGLTVATSKLAGGVDQVLGTAAPGGSVRTDGTNAWIALWTTTEEDTSGWHKLTVGDPL